MQPTQLQTCHRDVAFLIVAREIMTWDFFALTSETKEGLGNMNHRRGRVSRRMKSSNVEQQL